MNTNEKIAAIVRAIENEPSPLHALLRVVANEISQGIASYVTSAQTGSPNVAALDGLVQALGAGEDDIAAASLDRVADVTGEQSALIAQLRIRLDEFDAVRGVMNDLAETVASGESITGTSIALLCDTFNRADDKWIQRYMATCESANRAEQLHGRFHMLHSEYERLRRMGREKLGAVDPFALPEGWAVQTIFARRDGDGGGLSGVFTAILTWADPNTNPSHWKTVSGEGLGVLWALKSAIEKIERADVPTMKDRAENGI